MRYTKEIKEAAFLLKEGFEVTFIMNKKNMYEFLSFFYWQYHFKTLRSFRKIIFTCKPNSMYYLLKFIESVSFGYYKVY